MAFAVMTLTDAAASRVKAIVDNAGGDAKGIRVGIKKGGCAGMEYTIDLVTEPNAKDDLTRIPLREKWDAAMIAYCADLQAKKPVIYCGDMNVAHTEDDLANPKPNRGKKGFTEEERGGFDHWLAAGFVDTLRIFKQGNGFYTWWSHFANARARNVGWRIDYFLVSETLKAKVKAANIHAEQMGSDHCPISITLEV